MLSRYVTDLTEYLKYSQFQISKSKVQTFIKEVAAICTDFRDEYINLINIEHE